MPADQISKKIAMTKRLTQTLTIVIIILGLIIIQPSWEQPVVQGHGPTIRAGQNVSLWYSPRELDFGRVGVDMVSDQQIVTLTNVGDTVIDFAGGGTSAPFSASQNCAGGLAPGGSCQYFYKFSPTSSGVFSATVGPSSNAGPITITLRGSGVGSDFAYTPRSLDFGKVLSGNTSSAQAVTIKNTGLAALSFAGGAPPAPFSASQNCGGSLAPGGSCQFFYTFAPTAGGLFTTTTGPSSNAGKPIQVKLRGRGITNIFLGLSGFTVSPLELDFGPVGVGSLSPSQSVNIRNTSLITLTDFAGGGVSAPFSAAQNCAGGVPPGGSCQYTFSFSPQSSGVFSTTSNTVTNLGSFTILLHGNGQGAELAVSPLRLEFGPVPLGQTSPSQVVTIKNVGQSTLTNFAGGGVSAPFSAAQNCAGGVPPGGSCQYTFSFSPTAPGRYSSSSNSVTNAGPITIHLAGGMAPPAMAQQFIPATTTTGQAVTLELAISNPNPTLALTGVAVNNTLPAGLIVASPASFSLSPECGSAGFSPAAGATTLSFSGGTISGVDTCLIRVAVTAQQAGQYLNSTNAVGAANPAGIGNAATATLVVTNRQYLPVILK